MTINYNEMDNLTGAQLVKLIATHSAYKGMTEYQIKKSIGQKMGKSGLALVGDLRKEVINLGLDKGGKQSTKIEKEDKPEPIKKISPKKITPEKISPKKIVPEKISPKKITPEKVIPKKIIPEKVIPKKIIPEKISPKKIVPEKIVPEKISPKKITPEKVIPKKIIPKKISPKNITPEKVIPKKITPEKIIPKKNTPEKISPKKLNVINQIPEKEYYTVIAIANIGEEDEPYYYVSDSFSAEGFLYKEIIEKIVRHHIYVHNPQEMKKKNFEMTLKGVVNNVPYLPLNILGLYSVDWKRGKYFDSTYEKPFEY